MRPETPKKTKEVARKLKQNMDARARYNCDAMVESLEIKKDVEIVPLVGNEIVTIANQEDEAAAWLLRDTCEDPREVSAEASRTRMELVSYMGAEALVLVADTAETIGAKNSLEKMLAGQIGVTHYLIMSLARQINEIVLKDLYNGAGTKQDQELDAEIMSRYTAAYSRLSKVMDGHLQTLQKMRTGGRQTVTVQHQHVQVAGQAIVTQNREGNGGIDKKR